MAKEINGNDLIALGYPKNKILGIALKVNKKRTGYTREEMLRHYAAVLAHPHTYVHDKIFSKLATAIIQDSEEALKKAEAVIALKENVSDYLIYGLEYIEEGALHQMDTAMKLPVAVAGALMPDAHQGYGLPIGGVLAVKNAVIPYGVGVDIGCRMALSVYDIPESYFEKNIALFEKILLTNTCFGAGNGFEKKQRSDHEVMEHPLFKDNLLISQLKDKAWMQLGSSGGGNHFVEFGILRVNENDPQTGLMKGRYLSLLSHSGSRGLGATVANHFTKLAKALSKLPPHARNLAYLTLDTEEGMAYWNAMTLSGDYASANHEIIHKKIAKALGAEVITKVENHHNFAWKEEFHGEEVIVHRKGATPAGKGVLGIIPGSMTAPGFLVRGKGNPASLNSASHGAGRNMSRTRALSTITSTDMKKALREAGVILLGGGKDEAPMAYKNIHTVMAAQAELVDIIAEFSPKMVRMADDGSRED